jgi:hypothetical protein
MPARDFRTENPQAQQPGHHTSAVGPSPELIADFFHPSMRHAEGM